MQSLRWLGPQLVKIAEGCLTNNTSSSAGEDPPHQGQPGRAQGPRSEVRACLLRGPSGAFPGKKTNHRKKRNMTVIFRDFIWIGRRLRARLIVEARTSWWQTDWLLKQRGQRVVLGVVVANRSGDRSLA